MPFVTTDTAESAILALKGLLKNLKPGEFIIKISVEPPVIAKSEILNLFEEAQTNGQR